MGGGWTCPSLPACHRRPSPLRARRGLGQPCGRLRGLLERRYELEAGRKDGGEERGGGHNLGGEVGVGSGGGGGGLGVAAMTHELVETEVVAADVEAGARNRRGDL